MHHRQRVLVAAQVHAEQELERRRLRELGRAAEAAPLAVELARQGSGRLAEHALGERIGRRRELGRASYGIDHRRGLARDVAAPVAVGVRHRLEHLAEARQPVARLGREVRPAEERLAVGREEDGHRPAPVAGHRDHRVHVHRVDVRPLLAVDLDVHEALVHERRRLIVLERLVLHDVAPVAGGVPDREQDRPVLGPRPRERLVAPRVPVDRVVRVLEEVRARLLSEAIHAHTLPMRAGFLILACALLLSSDAHAAPPSPFVPQSIAFWDAQHGLATFGACGHVSCLGEIATTSNGGRTGWSGATSRGSAVSTSCAGRGTPGSRRHEDFATARTEVRPGAPCPARPGSTSSPFRRRALRIPSVVSSTASS